MQNDSTIVLHFFSTITIFPQWGLTTLCLAYNFFVNFHTLWYNSSYRHPPTPPIRPPLPLGISIDHPCRGYEYLLEPHIMQKISILPSHPPPPPQQKDFWFPLPSGNSSLGSYFASKILTFKTPLGMDFFWNCTLFNRSEFSTNTTLKNTI